jgi:hypothetical protein
MKLKKLESYLDFITAVQTCKGDVSFNSAEGDHLNLRSTFCQILFASVCTDRDFLSGGEILCSRPSDYERLRDFLEEDPD